MDSRADRVAAWLCWVVATGSFEATGADSLFLLQAAAAMKQTEYTMWLVTLVMIVFAFLNWFENFGFSLLLEASD